MKYTAEFGRDGEMYSYTLLGDNHTQEKAKITRANESDTERTFDVYRVDSETGIKAVFEALEYACRENGHYAVARVNNQVIAFINGDRIDFEEFKKLPSDLKKTIVDKIENYDIRPYFEKGAGDMRLLEATINLFRSCALPDISNPDLGEK